MNGSIPGKKIFSTFVFLNYSMQKFRSYISMLMMALLLFPMVEKAVHEYGHSDDEHCGVKDTHFCEVEHHCSICDYTFSSPTGSPECVYDLEDALLSENVSLPVFESNTTTSPKYTFSLRGPPVC
jgi:hypothetical protein